MTDKKTDETVSDPTADELVVIALHQEIEELKQRNLQLEFRAGGMGDIARMNVAGDILCAMISAEAVNTQTDIRAVIPHAIEAADMLIQHYQDIIQENEVIYQQRLQEQQEGDPGDGNTGTVQ